MRLTCLSKSGVVPGPLLSGKLSFLHSLAKFNEFTEPTIDLGILPSRLEELVEFPLNCLGSCAEPGQARTRREQQLADLAPAFQNGPAPFDEPMMIDPEQRAKRFGIDSAEVSVEHTLVEGRFVISRKKCVLGPLAASKREYVALAIFDLSADS